jgi:NAD-dependent deacetylase
MDDTTIADVANILRDAESVLFITGAGVSADSGLPTYRGVGGLYAGQDTEDGIAIEEALSGPMFAKRPELTWKYLWQIGSACGGAVPNRAHDIIAKIEAEKRDVWVMTQNVDGLHRAAGSKNLVEVHGHMFDLHCIECGCDYTARELVGDFETPPTLPPKCIGCGGIVRPDVVLFDEAIPLSVVQAMNNLLSKRFDVVFSIGTSAVFQYIRQPLSQAHGNGSTTVEINPTQTEISDCFCYRIQLGAADAMQRIMDCMD